MTCTGCLGGQRVSVANDYAEKVRETVFACLYVTQLVPFSFDTYIRHRSKTVLKVAFLMCLFLYCICSKSPYTVG